MSSTDGHMRIAAGTHLTGQIRGGSRVEIAGSAEGSIVTRHLVIAPGGSFNGNVRVDSAEVHGRLRGTVSVRNLISVSETGDVEGDVEYGQLALSAGSNFEADVRNVPPELAGDFELEVAQGGSAKITPEDLNATDTDNSADELTFTATNLLNGYIAMANAIDDPVMQFTQADVNTGKVMFVHNGGETANAGFDVQVMDAAGATAGPSRPVLVKVTSGTAGRGVAPETQRTGLQRTMPPPMPQA